MSTVPGAEYDRLRRAWEEAVRRYEVDDSEANYTAEQAAWDALIDYVEARGLNYTQYDPREEGGWFFGVGS